MGGDDALIASDSVSFRGVVRGLNQIFVTVGSGAPFHMIR
jgi:hypothetical protein